MDGVDPGAGDRPVDRDPRRQRQDPHRRRRRQPRAPHLPDSCSTRRSAPGITTIIGGGTGPAEGTKATTVTPGSWNTALMLQALDGVAAQRRAAGQGQHRVRRRAARAGRSAACPGFKLHEDWGTTPAAIDACLRASRRAGRAGGDPHRHPQRGRLRAVARSPPSPAGRSTRTTPRVRAAATRRTSSPSSREPNVLPSSTNPTRPAHGQHHRRAPRHAHGVPPPEPVDPRGPGLRREPHPAVDHRRRGRAPRPRRHLDDRLGQPGHGPHRRGRAAHVADRPRDEARGAARCPATAPADNHRARRYVAKYTICPAVAHGLDAEVGSVEVGKLADLVLWDPAFFGVQPGAGAQGRDHRLGADGRRQRVDPDARSRSCPGRCSAPSPQVAAGDEHHLRRAAARSSGRPRRPARRSTDARGGARLPVAHQGRHAREHGPARRARRRRHLRGDDRRRARRGGAGRPSCRWRSATSSSDARRRSPPSSSPTDRAVPTGGHVHSAGVESAVADGRIVDVDDARRPTCVGRLHTAGARPRRRSAAGRRCCTPRSSSPRSTPRPRPASRAGRCGRRRAGSAASSSGSPAGAGPTSGRWPTLPAEPHQPVALGRGRRRRRARRRRRRPRSPCTTPSTTPAQAALRLLGLDPFAVAALTARARRRGRASWSTRRVAAAGGPLADLPARTGPVVEIAAAAPRLARPPDCSPPEETAMGATPRHDHHPAPATASGAAARRHRRAGRQRQDRAGRRACAGPSPSEASASPS